jgi:hypothetical protein
MDDEHNYMDDGPGDVPEGYVPGSDADIHVSSILFTGVIGAVLLIVIVMLLKALYYHTLEVERDRKQGKGIDLALSDLRNKQLEEINSYRWVNAHTGQVGIPIDVAMQLVWQEQSGHASEGIEILDWDHAPSDQHPVPGDMMSLLRGETFGGRTGAVPMPPVAVPPQNQENISGAATTLPQATAGTEAGQKQAQQTGEKAAGGNK